MLRGLDKIREKTQEIQAISSGDRIRYLFLDDGEAAIVRFMTDTDEIIEAKFHEVQEMTPSGNRWRKRYCTFDDSGICQWCSQGNVPRRMLFLWSYVYYILHRKQNPTLEVDSNAQKWDLMKSGSSTYYKEEVNEPRVFRTKAGKDGLLRKMFVDFAEEYGTWCDRDYKWSRSGKGLDTTYSLLAKDPKKMEKGIKDIIPTLPNLGDVITGKQYTFSSGKTEKEEVENEVPESKQVTDEELF